MKIVEPSVEIINYTPNALWTIEKAGRVCYQSANQDDPESFVRRLIRKGHHSVLEHGVISVRLIVDRGVSHELVRHRLASFSQESTRYVSYKNGLTIIKPDGFEPDSDCYNIWYDAMLDAEEHYRTMIDYGASPQEARAVLPNSLKAEIVMTANIREWRHVLALRLGPAAHPDIRHIMVKVLAEFQAVFPALFEDIAIEKAAAVNWVTFEGTPETLPDRRCNAFNAGAVLYFCPLDGGTTMIAWVRPFRACRFPADIDQEDIPDDFEPDDIVWQRVDKPEVVWLASLGDRWAYLPTPGNEDQGENALEALTLC